MEVNNLIKDVEIVLREYVKPIIYEHGGDIKIKSINDGVVMITLYGKCKGCPSAQITIEEIVKSRLLEKLGDKIKDVKLYSEVSDELWKYAKAILRENKI